VTALGLILSAIWLLCVRWYIQARAWPPHALEELEESYEGNAGPTPSESIHP